MKERGCFISVEGIDGAGTSTVVDAIAKEFDGVVTTSEPTRFNTGLRVRQALSMNDMDNWETLFRFLEDRRYHNRTLIEPAVQDGRLVVTDRYTDSTLAYQGNELSTINWKETKNRLRDMMKGWCRKPDFTIYIDTDVPIAMERCDSEDEFDQNERIQRNAKNAYESLVQAEPHRFIVVDGNQPKEAMIEDALWAVRQALWRFNAVTYSDPRFMMQGVERASKGTELDWLDETGRTHSGVVVEHTRHHADRHTLEIDVDGSEHNVFITCYSLYRDEFNLPEKVVIVTQEQRDGYRAVAPNPVRIWM